MKTLFKITLLFSMLSIAFIACNDDDHGTDTYIISYGIIQGENGKYSIKRDDGSILNIAVNLVPQISVKDGQRVIANYTLLEKIEKSSEASATIENVRLNMLYSVLSKESVAESFILADKQKRNDSIGDDPIHILDVWFGGEYLNINFEVERYAGSNVVHFINLVHDDTYTESDSVMVTLRHNGYHDVPAAGMPSTYAAFGRVSFKISQLIPQDKESINLGLNWTEFGRTISDRVAKFDSGTFTPYASNTKAQSAGTLNKRVSESTFRLDKFATVVE